MRKFIYTLLTCIATFSYGQSLRELYQEGVKAYEEKNYKVFREKMETINSMRPNYPAVVYNLAGSYALTDDSEKSLETLERYILMDATQDFTKDEDFSSIVDLKEFNRIVDKQKRLVEEKEFNEAMRIPLLKSHPESIAYSKKQKSFFIGGAHDGNIWKVGQEGKPELWAKSPKNSWSVMGLEVSHDEKTLWVCTSSMNNYAEFNQNEEGYASVLKYNLKTGELLETLAIPGGHNFGDLVSDKKGNVYISDGTANMLYWVSNETSELEVLVDLSDKVFNLQGLSLDDSQNAIYISDYIDGIYKIDIQSKQVSKLRIDGDDILIKGIDGLYFKENSLIGLHNGTKPNRVIRYQLSESGDAIVDKKILSQAGELGEPTQGVWKDGSFFFIVNSPWAAYDQDGNFNPLGEDIIIGKIE